MGLEEYFKEKIRRKSFAKITAKKSRGYCTNAAKSGQLEEKRYRNKEVIGHFKKRA
jgi:hypothetical protein